MKEFTRYENLYIALFINQEKQRLIQEIEKLEGERRLVFEPLIKSHIETTLDVMEEKARSNIKEWDEKYK